MPREIYSLVAIKGCDENRTTALAPNSRTDQMHGIKVGSFCFGSKLEVQIRKRISTQNTMFVSQAMCPEWPLACQQKHLSDAPEWIFRLKWSEQWEELCIISGCIANVLLRCLKPRCGHRAMWWKARIMWEGALQPPLEPFLPVTKWKKTHWD